MHNKNYYEFTHVLMDAEWRSSSITNKLKSYKTNRINDQRKAYFD